MVRGLLPHGWEEAVVCRVRSGCGGKRSATRAITSRSSYSSARKTERALLASVLFGFLSFLFFSFPVLFCFEFLVCCPAKHN